MDKSEMNARIDKMGPSNASALLATMTILSGVRAKLGDEQMIDLIRQSLECARFTTICDELKFWHEQIQAEPPSQGELLLALAACYAEAASTLQSALLKHKNLCEVLLAHEATE